MHELRIALRMLRRAPSVSIPVIAVWTLAIGMATALYAVIYAMWLRPLPYADPARLVSVNTYFPSLKLNALLSPDFGQWQGTQSLGPLAAYDLRTAAMTGSGDVFEVSQARVSGNLLEILGVKPALGRPIQPADDRPGAPGVAVLSDRLWRDRFGADPGVIGRSVRIDGAPYTIVGVLPRDFRMPDERSADVLTPLALNEAFLRHDSKGAMRILRGVARLHAPMSEAGAELSTRLAQSRAAAPSFYRSDVTLRVLPLRDYLVRDVRSAGMLLTGVMAVILLIASANAAGLLLARAAGRAREIAIRISVGASPRRIARHLLTEGLVLGGIGTTGGLVLANALLQVVQQIRPAAEPIGIDRQILATSSAVGLLCCLVFSLAPVLPFPRTRVRQVLVVSELSLSLILLTGAALLLENLARLRAIAPGFRTDHILTASLSLRGTAFAERSAELRRELRERLGQTPGVVSVAFADDLPSTGAARITTFSRSDRPLPEPFHRGDNVLVRLVDSAFFETMGIPLRGGRIFNDHDSPRTAVVNRALADRYFAGESALGKQVDGLGAPWKTVVGIVGDTRNDGLLNPTRPEIYLPFPNGKPQGGGLTTEQALHIAIRSAADPSALASVLRNHLCEIDRTLLAKVRPMDEQWSGLMAGPRFHAFVLSAFAALALLMACAGVYGVLSHLVVLRRRDIGIRLALGARPADIRNLILGEALLLASAGAVLGIAGSLASARLLASVLTGINPRDPLTLAAAASCLVALAVAASAWPALAAARQDPADVLRAE